MKAYIRQRIAEGATEAQIKDELVDQFGGGCWPSRRRRASTCSPGRCRVAAGRVGAFALGAVAWAWARRRSAETDADARAGLDAEAERRVDAALEEFDD